QRELEASRARYRELFDCAPFAMLVIDRETRIELANRAAMEMLGLPKDEVVGVRLPRFVDHVEAEAFERHRRDVIASRERVRARFTLVSPGGRRSVTFESACMDPTREEWRTVLREGTYVGALEPAERRGDRPSFPATLP